MKRAALPFLVLAALAAGLWVSPGAAQPPSEKVVRLPFPKYDGTLTPYTSNSATRWSTSSTTRSCCATRAGSHDLGSRDRCGEARAEAA